MRCWLTDSPDVDMASPRPGALPLAPIMATCWDIFQLFLVFASLHTVRGLRNVGPLQNPQARRSKYRRCCRYDAQLVWLRLASAARPRSRKLQRWAAPLARCSLPSRCGPPSWAFTHEAPASRHCPAAGPCSGTTLWWCCPRATRAMGRDPLRRIAGVGGLSPLLSRVTARAVVAPLAGWPPWCDGRQGSLGPVLPSAWFAGRPRRRVSRTLKNGEIGMTVPWLRGPHVRGPWPHHTSAAQVIQQLTVPTSTQTIPRALNLLLRGGQNSAIIPKIASLRPGLREGAYFTLVPM